MEVQKYANDLKLLREYYYQKYTNPKYHEEANKHQQSYREMNGTVFGGRYLEDEN